MQPQLPDHRAGALGKSAGACQCAGYCREHEQPGAHAAKRRLEGRNEGNQGEFEADEGNRACQGQIEPAAQIDVREKRLPVQDKARER